MKKNEKTNAGNMADIANDLSLGMKFIDPRAIIETLEIKEGMTLGDFGCGTGYFSFPLAKKVGQNGKVYSLDILKEKLEVVESEAKILRLNNIITRRANLEVLRGSGFEDGSLDWVCLVNMLFQNKNKKPIIEEAIRVLKKGGKMLIIEWNDNNSFGPEKKIRVSQNEIASLALEIGLTISSTIEISNFHYGIILEK